MHGETASKRQRTQDPAEQEGDCSGNDSSSSSRRTACSASVASKRPPVSIPFDLDALEREIEVFRADPPPYVGTIGHLRQPAMVCDEEGNMAKPTSEGPWDLLVELSGQNGDEAYGFTFRVVLQFDCDLWPMKLAIVRFKGVFHHALTDEGGGMLMPFYRALPRDDRGACTLKLMLEHVHTFLVNPLTSWRIPAEKASKQVLDAIDSHRKMNEERLSVIRKYAAQALHRELFQSPPHWRQEWLDPDFHAAAMQDSPSVWRGILTEHVPGDVFSFRLLTDAFCDKLVAEIFNFYASGLPARRPNSMNNYGIILNDIGLEPLIDELQRLLQPLGALLFPGPGSAWDGHHCFIVRYRAGEDLGLDMHTDDSDVTFNVCLGIDFTGAGLQFCGIMGAPTHRKYSFTFQHTKGRCICHLGKKRHGADSIKSGERLNLILWNHSNAYRQCDEYVKPSYSTEEGPPDAVCVSYTHDRDYGLYKEYPSGKEHFKGRGWCPRPSFEYSGFKPDCEEECLGSCGC